MTLDHLAHLESDAAAFVAAVRRTGPDAPVPGCPGWALRDLAVHLGTVHRWVAAIVRTGDRQPMQAWEVQDADLAGWCADSAAEVLDALGSAEPDRPCWTFPGAGETAFWRRRMAHETAVHRVDAERTAGSERPLDPALAEDGIAEVLEVMHPRQVALGRTEAPTTGIALATATTRRLGPVPTAVTVSGPPDAVLLLLWGRLPRTDPRLEVTGDVAALDRLLETPVTP